MLALTIPAINAMTLLTVSQQDSSVVLLLILVVRAQPLLSVQLLLSTVVVTFAAGPYAAKATVVRILNAQVQQLTLMVSTVSPLLQPQPITLLLLVDVEPKLTALQDKSVSMVSVTHAQIQVFVPSILRIMYVVELGIQLYV